MYRCGFAILCERFVARGKEVDSALNCVGFCGNVVLQIERPDAALLSGVALEIGLPKSKSGDAALLFGFDCRDAEGRRGGGGGSGSGGWIAEAEISVKTGRPGKLARSVVGFTVPSVGVGVGVGVGMMDLSAGSSALNRGLRKLTLVVSTLLSDRSSASKAFKCSARRTCARSEPPAIHSRSRARFFSHSS